MLKLQRIEIENFLSFYGCHEFVFEDHGIILIRGSNKDNVNNDDLSHHSIGSGKSNLFLAPQFAFFGSISKNINKNDVVNKKSKRNTKVSIDFTIHEKYYRIIRYRKYAKYKNDVLIFERNNTNEEWVNISAPDIRETQKTINDIIIINEDTFLKSVLLTRDDNQQFLEFNNYERGKLFENIIQLNKLKEYWKKVQQQIKQEERDNVILYSDITSIKSENKTYAQQILEDTEKLEKLEREYKNELRELKNKLKALNKTKLSEQDLIQTIHECVKVYKELQDKEINLQHKEKELNIENSRKNSLNDRINYFQTQIEDYTSNLENLKPIECYNCGAIQNEDEFKKEKQKIENKISLNQKKVQEFQDEITIPLEKIKQINLEIKNIKNKISQLKKELTQFTTILPKQIISEIKNEKENNIINELQNLNSEIKIVETKIESIDWEYIKNFKTKIKGNNKKLKSLEQQKETSDKKIAMLDFWLQTLDLRNENSIKQHILSQVIPVFNNILQVNMNKIYNGNLLLIFDQFFNDTIIYNGDEYKYHELSTGEKVKVNLAINLSIFDMIKINLHGSSVIFLDEILVHVDKSTIQNTIDLIEEKYASDACIYLVSHDIHVQEYLQQKGYHNMVHIIKENGESKVN